MRLEAKREGHMDRTWQRNEVDLVAAECEVRGKGTGQEGDSSAPAQSPEGCWRLV